jgi:uncharacterized protein (TIGR03437 family)
MRHKAGTVVFALSLCAWVLAPRHGAAQTLVATPSKLTFQTTADSTTLPPPQTFQLTSPDGKVPFFAVVSGGSWYGGNYPVFLSVTPSSGTTPATLTVTLLPMILPWGYGRYYDYIGIASGTMIAPVGVITVIADLLIDLPPPPVVTSIVNAATLQPGISPGAIVSIFGDRIGPAIAERTGATSTIYDPRFFFPAVLGYTKVLFNGISAPLFYASRAQVNAVVPYEVAGRDTVEVILAHQFMSAPAVTLPLLDTSPGVFPVSQNGNGPGAILNQNWTLNGPENPAAAGSTIQIFATGAGLWSPSVPTGLQLAPRPPYAVPIAPVSVAIGGQPAEVVSANGVPNFISGLLVVKAVVPSGLDPGPQPVLLTIGQNDNSQQQVTVVVQ